MPAVIFALFKTSFQYLYVPAPLLRGKYKGFLYLYWLVFPARTLFFQLKELNIFSIWALSARFWLAALAVPAQTASFSAWL